MEIKKYKTLTKNKLLRMDNVGIVVEFLDDAISFFTEIGLKLEGRGTIEGVDSNFRNLSHLQLYQITGLSL